MDQSPVRGRQLYGRTTQSRLYANQQQGALTDTRPGEDIQYNTTHCSPSVCLTTRGMSTGLAIGHQLRVQ